MLLSVPYGPAETVAIAVFKRQALQVEARGNWGPVSVVKAGTLLVAVGFCSGACVLLATGAGEGCTLLGVRAGGGCTLFRAGV